MSTMTEPLLSDAPDGVVTVADDALSVVFHRRYRQPIEKVWAALTVPERLAAWFADADIDLRVGGKLRLNWNKGAHQAEMTITVCEPPRSLAWIWELGGRATLVRFDLAPDGDGCALTLTHSGLSPRAGPGSGVRAGWHAHLEGLGVAAAGGATPWATKVAREDALASRYPPLPA